jgi:CheY-like chemotaxis protein
MESDRILLVEDDPFLRRACEAGLRKRGYQVITAVDGEEALQRVRSDPPALILLDLLMPKLSGIEVLAELKQDEKTRDIPVIILTNSSTEIERKKTAALGAVGYLVKANLSLKELADYVAGFLEAHKHPSCSRK